jgi:hypothetical protein
MGMEYGEIVDIAIRKARVMKRDFTAIIKRSNGWGVVQNLHEYRKYYKNVILVYKDGTTKTCEDYMNENNIDPQKLTLH